MCCITYATVLRRHRKQDRAELSTGFAGRQASQLIASRWPAIAQAAAISIVESSMFSSTQRPVPAVQDEPYTEGDGYLDSETGFYDDVYGDYVFDEAEAQTSTCMLDRLTGKIQLTGFARSPDTMRHATEVCVYHGLSCLAPHAAVCDADPPHTQ